ncbi:MAG: hypothetical protein ACRC62_25760 [Microcoleus sp.]
MATASGEGGGCMATGMRRERVFVRRRSEYQDRGCDQREGLTTLLHPL